MKNEKREERLDERSEVEPNRSHPLRSVGSSASRLPFSPRVILSSSRRARRAASGLRRERKGMTRGGDKGLHNKFCCPWFLILRTYYVM